jgi:hypothetical protein
MARPWKEIKQRNDWQKHEVDRDLFMADNIVRDLREHEADKRHALFIVGYGHAMVKLTQPGGTPQKTAGWHLSAKLGATNVFAFFPHSPVMSNNGEVDGRLALGLFETAFAALGNKPMAFPLDHGPFGEHFFDASLDLVTADLYRNGYHAYLYLGPLEKERFSSMIPGFYTADFVQELERRSRLTFGQGLKGSFSFETVDPETFGWWMSQSWGQPRRAWARLGPLNAWQWGSDWENKLRADKRFDAAQDSTAIRREAELLFESLRQADYSKPHDWRNFPSPAVEYWVQSDAPGWQKWICQQFRTNPIVKVELGEVSLQADGRPAVPYQAVLKDNSRLEGVLPFEWRPAAQRWEGLEGLDWHRRR